MEACNSTGRNHADRARLAFAGLHFGAAHRVVEQDIDHPANHSNAPGQKQVKCFFRQQELLTDADGTLPVLAQIGARRPRPRLYWIDRQWFHSRLQYSQDIGLTSEELSQVRGFSGLDLAVQYAILQQSL